MALLQEQSFRGGILSSGLDDESPSYTQPIITQPKFPSVYTAIFRKITRLVIIGGILGLILFAGTIGFLVENLRNKSLNNEVNRLNEIIFEKEPASSSHTFIIRTASSNDTSKLPAVAGTTGQYENRSAIIISPVPTASSVNTSKGVDKITVPNKNVSIENNSSRTVPEDVSKLHKSTTPDKISKNTTRNFKTLPPNAIEIHPMDLLTRMGIHPVFEFIECKNVRTELGFKCTAAVRDLIFTGYGKSKKDCRKSLAQKACHELYNLNYTDVQDTTSIMSDCSASQ